MQQISVDLRMKELSAKMDHVEGITTDGFKDMAAHIQCLENQSSRHNIKALEAPENESKKFWNGAEKWMQFSTKIHLEMSDEEDTESSSGL